MLSIFVLLFVSISIMPDTRGETRIFDQRGKRVRCVSPIDEEELSETKLVMDNLGWLQ